MASLRDTFISGASQPTSESTPVKSSSSSFIQPVSESDVTKGVSSLETPTSDVEVESLESGRRRSSRRSRSTTTTVVEPVVESVVAPVVSSAPDPLRSSDPNMFGGERIDVVDRGGSRFREIAERVPGVRLSVDAFDLARDRFGDFKSDVAAGFGAGSGLAYDPSLVGRVRSGAGTFGEETGLLLGGLGFAAGGEIGRGAEALVSSGRAAVQASRAGQLVTKTRPGRLVAQLGEAVVESELIIGGSKLLGRGRLTPEEREFAQTPDFKDVIGAGRKAEEAAVRSEGVSFTTPSGRERGFNPRALAFDVVGSFTSGKPGRAGFERGVREALTEQGLSPEQVSLGVSAAKGVRRSEKVGEFGALLNIARFSERVGSKELEKTFETAAAKGLTMSAAKGFKGAFQKASVITPSIGQAGFVEGFTQEVSQQRVLDKPVDVTDALTMGAVGAVSAGTIGGAIGGFKDVSPGFSRRLDIGASILDPFEKPGDFLANIRTSRAPVITSTVDKGGRGQLSFGVSPSPVDSSPVVVSPSAPSQSPFSPGPVFSVGSSPIDGIKVTPPSISRGGRGKGSSPVTPSVPVEIPFVQPRGPFSPVPIGVRSDVPSEVPVPVDIPSLIPAEIPSQVPVNIQTDVFSFTQTPSQVPVVVPTKGFLPPGLFQTPMGSPGWGVPSKKGKKKKGRATKSVGQSLFSLPDFGVKQDGKSEVTGLFFRF